jgi:ABC-type methionine transport system ATPase subunit
MAVVKQEVYCTFPKDQIREPHLYNLGQTFQVVPNIRGASINDEIGLVYLELEGEEEEVKRAIAYLRERKVQVDDVPEGGGEFPPR